MSPAAVPTFTKAEIADIADHFRNQIQRWRFWVDCGIHDVAALPVTADTREPFCPRCCVFFSDADSAIDAPQPPASLPWLCDRCGRRVADDEVLRTDAGAIHLTSAMTAAGAPMPITCGPLRAR